MQNHYLISCQFCTCHDNGAVVACTKSRIIFQHRFRKWLGADKLLSEPMVVSLLIHICVTRSQVGNVGVQTLPNAYIESINTIDSPVRVQQEFTWYKKCLAFDIFATAFLWNDLIHKHTRMFWKSLVGQVLYRLQFFSGIYLLINDSMIINCLICHICAPNQKFPTRIVLASLLYREFEIFSLDVCTLYELKVRLKKTLPGDALMIVWGVIEWKT